MDIARFILRGVAATITDTSFVFIMVILSLVLYNMNKKVTVMQKMIIGESLNSPIELTISQLVLGVFGGLLASIILAYSGIIFVENSVIVLLFMFSIVLMFWNPRLICFSYSGAVLGFMSIVANDFLKIQTDAATGLYSVNLDIVTLMTLVGVIHIVEGLLVMLDGSRGAVPVFANRNGRIIGGFALKRYWPIPVVLFFIFTGEIMGGGEPLREPNWWPLINSPYTAQFLATAVLSLVPLYAVLGYNSITFTKDRTEKAVVSGAGIVIYGILLSFVAQLAAYGTAFRILVVIFAPAAHEFMIRINRYFELNSKPKYDSEGDGIMILEVAPGSPAAEMGLKSGDRLIEINDRKINDENDIVDNILGPINYIWFKVRRENGEENEVNYTNLSKERRLGVVFVPKGVPKDSMIVKFEEGRFKDIFNRLKDRDENDGDDGDDEE
jgi:hypothetical protein